jgi:hypothetical protein
MKQFNDSSRFSIRIDAALFPIIPIRRPFCRIDELLDCSAWEWAVLDGDRLVWAPGGCIYAGHVSGAGLTEQERLFDFNGMRFEAVVAPY